jgi:hypothetical protein
VTAVATEYRAGRRVALIAASISGKFDRFWD